MEYITKKIPKDADKVLKYVQAHLQLEKGEKTTEADTIEYALVHIAEEQFNYKKKVKVKKGLGLLNYAALIKGGKSSSSKDIDREVYGV